MHTFFNDVTDWLSVGGDLDLARDVTGQDFPATVAQLREHGVTHVLDLRLHREMPSATPWIDGGFAAENYLHVPIDDDRSHIPPEEWYAAIEAFVGLFWLTSAEGDRLYVHCHMGINRAPSAAMLAMLTVDSGLPPFNAFLAVREARPAAGLVYAEAVGIRHLLNVGGVSLTLDSELPADVQRFSRAMRAYWTPERQEAVHYGIAYYRSREGGTLAVDTAAV